MKLKEFELKQGNHFIAMEYYGLILNRTFLVLITNDELIGLTTKDELTGLKVSGRVNIKIDSENIAIQKSTNSLTIKNDLKKPYSYAKSNFLNSFPKKNISSKGFLNDSPANFRIMRDDIVDVNYDKRKKWGMGPYPHDGKVYIKTNKEKKEFIILGNQSGEQIKGWIEKQRLRAS